MTRAEEGCIELKKGVLTKHGDAQYEFLVWSCAMKN